MKNSLLVELIDTWEWQASADKALHMAAREQLRACADTLRMLMSSQDQVHLVGVKGGIEHDLKTTLRMPPSMKAREIVRDMVGEPDEDAANDAALALWCCQEMIRWMQEDR